MTPLVLEIDIDVQWLVDRGADKAFEQRIAERRLTPAIPRT
jgi:hypothetical protein